MNWSTSALLYLYCILIGGLYHLGFWAPLNFNIFEFLTPIDILKSATYPLIPALMISFIFSAYSALHTYSHSFSPENLPQHEESKSTKIFYWSSMILLALIGVYHIANLLYLAYRLPEKRFLYVLTLFSALAVYYVFSRPAAIKNTKTIVKNALLLFITLLPTMSYYQGDKNINSKIDLNTSFYHLKKSSKNCEVTIGSKEIYLGFYGGMYFFINSDNRDICIEKDGGVQLTYFKYKEAIDI